MSKVRTPFATFFELTTEKENKKRVTKVSSTGPSHL
jgi:hypothetical protein